MIPFRRNLPRLSPHYNLVPSSYLSQCWSISHGSLLLSFSVSTLSFSLPWEGQVLAFPEPLQLQLSVSGTLFNFRCQTVLPFGSQLDCQLLGEASTTASGTCNVFYNPIVFASEVLSFVHTGWLSASSF